MFSFVKKIKVQNFSIKPKHETTVIFSYVNLFKFVSAIPATILGLNLGLPGWSNWHCPWAQTWEVLELYFGQCCCTLSMFGL